MEATHYIPQFVLRSFRDEGLYELEKSTGKCERRSVGLAGQHPDYYSPNIEHGVLQKWDNDAHRIFKSKILNKDRISLTSGERTTLAKWLALFFVRTPFSREKMTQFFENAFSDPEVILDVFRANCWRYLSDYELSQPQAYRLAIELFGRQHGRQFLICDMARQVTANPRRFLPKVQLGFDWHIDSRSFEHFGDAIGRMTWRWLHCPSGLVIGDNVVCRWDVLSGVPHHGSHLLGLEVTAPLTRTICVQMTHESEGDGENIVCDEDRAEELNRRQVAAASKYVYGPSRRHLKPELKYGFE